MDENPSEFRSHPYEDRLTVDSPAWVRMNSEFYSDRRPMGGGRPPPFEPALSSNKKTHLALERMSDAVGMLLRNVSADVANGRVAPNALRDGLDELDEVLDFWITAARMTNDVLQDEDELQGFACGQATFGDEMFRYLDREIPTDAQQRRYANVRRLIETHATDLISSLRTLCISRREALRLVTLDADVVYTEYAIEKVTADRLSTSERKLIAEQMKILEESLEHLEAAQKLLREYIATNFTDSSSTVHYHMAETNVSANVVGVVGSDAHVQNQHLGGPSGKR